MLGLYMKKTYRAFMKNKWTYFALGFLFILGNYMVLSLAGAAETIQKGTRQNILDSRCEKGQFRVIVPLQDAQKKWLEKKGVIFEEQFCQDVKQKDNSVIRIYQNRENINKIVLDEGRLAKNRNEIVIEKRYADEHNLVVNDSISIGNDTFKVVGIGSTVDYESIQKELSDPFVSSKQFGTAFVTKEGYELLKEKEVSEQLETYIYSYDELGQLTEKQLKDQLSSWTVQEILGIEQGEKRSNLIYFLEAKDNPRIGAAGEDKEIDRNASIICGILVFLLFAYIISAFVLHMMEKERKVIGTLLAMGVRKREIFAQYLILPVMIGLIFGGIGTMLGLSDTVISSQLNEAYSYFSLPQFEIYRPVYLFLYGLVLPPALIFFVNVIVIRRFLKKKPISLLKQEQAIGGANISLSNRFSFLRKFQMRQMIREIKTVMIVFVGLFLSLVILLLALNIEVSIRHLVEGTKNDIKFSHMYQYMETESEIPKGGEGGLLKVLKGETKGYQLEVSIFGVEKNSKFFDANVKSGLGNVVASDSFARKFGVEVGETIQLEDREGTKYKLKITEITPYTGGLTLFMDMDSMREYFELPSTGYQVVFSNKKLKIPASKLKSTVTKEDMVQGVEVIRTLMMPMCYTVCVIATFLLFLVLYLMTKIMVERSTFGISLAKIIGYRTKEIGILYLQGNLYTVLFSVVVGLPFVKMCVDGMYPYLVANVAAGMNLTYPWYFFVGVVLLVLLVYYVVHFLLMKRIESVGFGAILKES